MTLELTGSTADLISNALDARTVPDRVSPRKAPIVKHAQIELDTIARQTKYVADRKKSGAGMPNIVTPDAFIRGMRDLGYKDPSWALAELVDNSVQAGCTKVEVRFGFAEGNASQAKDPEHIALIDDGTGMTGEMLPFAVEWGGTDREGDRHGFGRYGYGLPSSCISLARRYTVYSKVKGGDWWGITVDIDQIASAGNDFTKIATLLVARKVTPPKWVMDEAPHGVKVSALPSGTVIVLENLDRLKKRRGWILRKALRDRLLKQFGMIYRHWVTEVKMVVDGALVEAIDPLFLLDHARLFDETPVRAKKVDERVFDVTTDDGKTGSVRIRAALLPPDFSWATPDDLSTGGKKNQRWKQVLAPTTGTNGLLVCREGRQIDVVQPDWTKFQNYDVYVKVEIDFDPVLDEFFNITTSKQQVRIEEAMWDRLVAPGPNGGNLRALVKDMRVEWVALNEALQARVAEAEKQKESERAAANAMTEAERFRTKTPRLSEEAKKEARENFEEEVATQAKEQGVPVEVAREQVKKAVEARPWDIEFQSFEEGPFFIPRRLGDQKRIIINTSHAFFSRLYDPATPATKAALEVLLFVLADGEINSDDEHAHFYRTERGHRWSPMLHRALTALVSAGELEDRESVKIERAEEASS